MKKNINIYIVGILALLLLGVNMVTLKKYKALKTYCQEQIADKSITGQKEMALWGKFSNCFLGEWNEDAKYLIKRIQWCHNSA